MHRLVNHLLFLYSYNIIEKHLANFKMATKMASRIRNNMAATMVSSAYCIKTSTIMLILVWQGHFWLINGLRYILVIETHFVKLIFPFDKFIFLEFLVWQRMFGSYDIAFILKRPVNTLLVEDWFLESCNTFRKVSNVFSLFFGCMFVCIFDRRGCSDLFLLFISVFWVWRAFL